MRFFNYLKTLLGMKVRKHADPKIELEMAMNDARKQDAKLRENAAMIVAHRNTLDSKIKGIDKELPEKTEHAREALMRAEQAADGGDMATYQRWEQAAGRFAVEIESLHSQRASFSAQLDTATVQAEEAKRQISHNADRLRQLTAKRMELLGKIEQANMQKSMHETMTALAKPLDAGSNIASSMGEIEAKIDRQLAENSARMELSAATGELDDVMIEQELSSASAKRRLEQLRSQLQVDQGSEAKQLPPAANE
jgi:phage shock protein A